VIKNFQARGVKQKSEMSTTMENDLGCRVVQASKKNSWMVS